MGCYLCAYLLSSVPLTPKPLPPKSPVLIREPLGTCWKCSISACGAHATRYGQFECAICTPAVAAQTALGAPPVPVGPGSPGDSTGSAATLARFVGRNASSAQKERVEVAVDRIREDVARAPIDSLDESTIGEPNLVSNLAGVIRKEEPNIAFVPEVNPEIWYADATPPPPGISIDALAAAVRGTFIGAGIEATTRPSTVEVITGAMLLAVTVANQPTPPAPKLDSVDPAEIDVPAPWEMTHPALLDPVMWMIIVAYRHAN